MADIHRSENLKTVEQYNHILQYLDQTGKRLGLEVRLVKFPRAVKMIDQYNLLADKPHITLVGPFGFLDYLALQYHAYGVISDSGTSQEECPMLRVPVVVPRNFTERPESVKFGNSILIGETTPVETMVRKTLKFFTSYTVSKEQIAWLGDGKTSQHIVNILKERLS